MLNTIRLSPIICATVGLFTIACGDQPAVGPGQDAGLVDTYQQGGDSGGGESGTKTYDIVFCNIRWNESVPALTDEAMAPTFQKVNDWFDEVSFGKAKFNFKVEGNVLVDFGSARYDEIALQICPSAAAADLFIVFPANNERPGAGNNYIASLGAYKSTMSVGYYNLDTQKLEFDGSKDVTTYVHEFGHALWRLMHAATKDCGDASFKKSGCKHDDYGLLFDAMGTRGGHFGGWYKYLAGWTKSQRITKSGSYNLAALELASAAPHNLRVPLKDSPLCIEYRKPIGIDGTKEVNQPYTDEHDSTWLVGDGCVLVKYCSLSIVANDDSENPAYFGNELQTVGLDLTPNSVSSEYSPAGDWVDGCLKAGDTFTDTTLGVTITFQGTNENTATIALEIDESQIEALPDLTLQNLSRQQSFEYGNFLGNPENPAGNSGYTGLLRFGAHYGGERELPLGAKYAMRVTGIRSDGSEKILVEKSFVYKTAMPPYIETTNSEAMASLRIEIDTGNEIAEANEDNNVLTIP